MSRKYSTAKLIPPPSNILNSLVIYSAILLRKTRFIFQPNFADRVSRSVDYFPLSLSLEKKRTKIKNERKKKNNRGKEEGEPRSEGGEKIPGIKYRACTG